jgi:hypothetical protein
MLSDAEAQPKIGITVMNLTARPKSISVDTLIGRATMVNKLGILSSEMEETLKGVHKAHVQGIIDGFPKELSEDERKKATDLVLKYSNAFSKSEFDIGRTKIISYRIDTGNHCPLRQQLRGHPRAHLDFIDHELDEELLVDVNAEEVKRTETRNFISEEVLAIPAENIAKEQDKDPGLSFIIQCKRRGLDPPTVTELAVHSEEVHLLCTQWDSLMT